MRSEKTAGEWRRKRLAYAVCVGLVIGLGLGLRSGMVSLPPLLVKYGADALWALAVFLLIGLLWPPLSTWRAAVLAVGLSVTIELSQLYHASWIDQVRSYRLAALVLGSSFAWKDLVAYAAGIAVGVMAELVARHFLAWRTRGADLPDEKTAASGRPPPPLS